MVIFIQNKWVFWENFLRKEMLPKLQSEIAKWKAADSTLDMQPALHYIAVTAQQSPGAAGKIQVAYAF